MILGSADSKSIIDPFVTFDGMAKNNSTTKSCSNPILDILNVLKAGIKLKTNIKIGFGEEIWNIL